MRKQRKEEGITLVALVVTIIVLIILATVSINIAINTGMLEKAGDASLMHAKAEELEKLEILKGVVAIDNGGKVTVENYIKELIKEKMIIEDKVEDNEDGSKDIVTLNGWNVNIAPDSSNLNNVIIEIDGKGEKTAARITKINLKRSEDRTSLTVSLVAKRAEGATYKYYYKTEQEEYILVYEGNETSYTITQDIIPQEFYKVKVEIVNEYGIRSKEVSEKDEIAPVAEIICEERGIQEGEIGRATIKQIDYESGVDILKCKWEINGTSEKLGVDEKRYSKEFTKEIEEINIPGDKKGTYYIHVLTVDQSGNKSETISDKILVGRLVTTITDTNHANILAIDTNADTLTVPGGFEYVTGTVVEQGIVIQDEKRNQFVWIPVKGEEDLERNLFDQVGVTTDNYTEPYKNGYATEESEYNAMREKVLEYKGFYMGRYEAGVDTTSLRTKATTAQTVVSKSGVAPYNYVPWGRANNDAGEVSGQSGAVYLAKNMYQNHDYVVSTLCYGCQRDAMCLFIGDSNRNTSLKSALELTGSVADDVSKNIYDLAGNCYEWTMEMYINNYRRVLRGGYYRGGYPVNERGQLAPTECREYIAFRCTLYIK